jgi:hypothetical protein
MFDPFLCAGVVVVRWLVMRASREAVDDRIVVTVLEGLWKGFI